MATLYFKGGDLAIAAAHSSRDATGKLDAACAFPEGKFLLPSSGRQIGDAGYSGFANEPFYRLRLPTWARTCLVAQNAAICQQEPR